MYRISFYCPDRHIMYDGDTPDLYGVGGGITSRVRMAKALAGLGNSVEMIVNTPQRRLIDNVLYVPLDQRTKIIADILILNTSGDELDLTPIRDVTLRTRLNILWVSGIAKPSGLEKLSIDYLYVKSNFLREYVTRNWGELTIPVFVTYNGVDERLFKDAESEGIRRDPFRLIYCSHPAKGLDSAIAITQRLRSVDPRYHLKVFGGLELWGQNGELTISEDGISYGGLIGQKQLVKELFQSTFAINLQEIQEGFGLALIESMRAGCIVLASNVGAFPEIIQEGKNGYIVPGDHQSVQLREKVRDKIIELVDQPGLLAKIRASAQSILWDTELISRTWVQHWQLQLNNGKPLNTGEKTCGNCSMRVTRMVDGDHCMDCGRFEPRQS